MWKQQTREPAVLWSSNTTYHTSVRGQNHHQISRSAHSKLPNWQKFKPGSTFLSWISYQLWFFVSGDIFGPSGETSNEKENEPRDADDTVLNKKGEFDGGGFLKDVKTVTPIFIYSNTVTMLSPEVGT